MRRIRRFKVNVPAGIRDGQQVRVRGRGEAGWRGGPAGDLYMLTHVRDIARSGDIPEVRVPGKKRSVGKQSAAVQDPSHSPLLDSEPHSTSAARAPRVSSDTGEDSKPPALRDRQDRDNGGSVAPPSVTDAEPIRIFYSYSHKDERHRERLETQLRLLRREGVIRDWHDRMIGAGDEWRESISDELSTADVILVLVSPDLLASDFAYEEELLRALERHARGQAKVVPIIVRPVGWLTTPLGKLQALPKDGKPITRWSNRDSAWHDVGLRLSRLINQLRDDSGRH